MRRSGKRILIVCAVLLALVGGWEAWRMLQKEPPPPVSLNPPPVATTPQPVAMPETPLRPVPPAPPVKKIAPPPARPIAKPAAKSVPPPSLPRPVSPSPQPHVVVPPPPVTLPAPPPEPMQWHGNDTSVNHAGQVVIRNDRQWVKFWSEHHPHEPAPEVDFANNMIIGVFVGSRPADQFAVQILNIKTLPANLVVEYREIIPPPGTFAMGVTVFPYALKAIPKSSLPVKFQLMVGQP